VPRLPPASPPYRGGRGVEADGISETARITGVAQRHWPAFVLIARKESRPAPALHQRGELPGEVDRVLDRRVVAEAAGRREEMNGIAGKTHAARAEALGYQGEAGGPGFPAQHLDRAFRAQRLEENGARFRLGNLRRVLARLELR